MEYEQEVVIEEVCLCLSHAENKLMIRVLISNFYLIIDWYTNGKDWRAFLATARGSELNRLVMHIEELFMLFLFFFNMVNSLSSK
jgi:hypothetical protein